MAPEISPCQSRQMLQARGLCLWDSNQPWQSSLRIPSQGYFLLRGIHISFAFPRASLCAHWTKIPFLFLHFFYLFQPHVADKWSLPPQGERLTPHFTSSCPEFSCPNFFLFAPPCTFTAPQGSCEKKNFSFQRTTKTHAFLCLYHSWSKI